MTYKNAANALVTAGLLGEANVPSAVSTLNTTAVGLTYPDWAQALANAGLIDQAKVEEAADVMQQAGADQTKDDPEAFNEDLENAGIL